MRAAVLLAMYLGGCSWLVQNHLPGGIDKYESSQSPQCNPSYGPAVVDGLLVALAVVGIVAANADDTLVDDDRSRAIAGGILDMLVFGASGITGAIWASQCREAGRLYASTEASDDATTRLARRRELEALRAEVARHEKPKIAVPATPRGFFCTISLTDPAIGFCKRERRACEAAQIGAALPPCVLVETAWCFDAGEKSDSWCSPTPTSCAAQKVAAVSVPDAKVGECLEAK